MHTRETRRILLHQARGMSGGSKNITRDFLIISELYFISISVNAGIAKTVWRFVDQLLWHTRETRRILLHQARGMSGGSKNITRDFLIISELYFISISVNAGIAKTVWRFVDQLLWHTRETRRILLHQARGMSGGSKNITRDFLLHSHVYFISISVHVGIFNYVLYINTCNFVVGFVDQYTRETRRITPSKRHVLKI
jgi:hypothetical protein